MPEGNDGACDDQPHPREQIVDEWIQDARLTKSASRRRLSLIDVVK